LLRREGEVEVPRLMQRDNCIPQKIYAQSHVSAYRGDGLAFCTRGLLHAAQAET